MQRDGTAAATHLRIELDASRLGDSLHDLLPLLRPDLLRLLLDLPELPLPILALNARLLLLRDLLSAQSPGLSFFAVSLVRRLFGPTLALFDRRLALEEGLALLGHFGRESGEGSGLCRKSVGERGEGR